MKEDYTINSRPIHFFRLKCWETFLSFIALIVISQKKVFVWLDCRKPIVSIKDHIAMENIGVDSTHLSQESDSRNAVCAWGWNPTSSSTQSRSEIQIPCPQCWSFQQTNSYTKWTNYYSRLLYPVHFHFVLSFHGFQLSFHVLINKFCSSEKETSNKGNKRLKWRW